jgi:macrolide transport system ATP-binding/permease protein
LEEVLEGFAGTLVMVSHDRALREWFARCARKSEKSRTDDAGRWIRYSMDNGVLAPA